MTLRFYLTPVTMAKIRNMSDRLCWRWRGCGEREIQTSWEWKLVQSLWKSIWQFLRKLETNLPQDSAIPLMSIYPKDVPFYHKYTFLIMFIAALFIITRSWKQPRCSSTEESIDKMWYVIHLHNVVTQPLKKKVTTWTLKANEWN